MKDNWTDSTGDVVIGDTVKFTEAVFSGSFRSPSYDGDREIIAKVVSDSYGKAKQQHTFGLEIISSSGEQPLPAGKRTRRKGRNVYKNGVSRLIWADENLRESACAEKHGRGDMARRDRDQRKMEALNL